MSIDKSTPLSCHKPTITSQITSTCRHTNVAWIHSQACERDISTKNNDQYHVVVELWLSLRKKSGTVAGRTCTEKVGIHKATFDLQILSLIVWSHLYCSWVWGKVYNGTRLVLWISDICPLTDTWYSLWTVQDRENVEEATELMAHDTAGTVVNVSNW